MHHIDLCFFFCLFVFSVFIFFLISCILYICIVLLPVAIHDSPESGVNKDHTYIVSAFFPRHIMHGENSRGVPNPRMCDDVLMRGRAPHCSASNEIYFQTKVPTSRNIVSDNKNLLVLCKKCSKKILLIGTIKSF